MPSSSDFTGRGWAFPLHLDSAGSFALSGGEQEIEEAIRLILGTSFGERPLRPEYGCGIHDLVFDTVDAAPLPDQPHVLGIAVAYRIKATNDRRNLVFPFYSIPEE